MKNSAKRIFAIALVVSMMLSMTISTSAAERTLSKGMSGNDVLVVQQQLYELGYLTATPDGIFGGMTEAAVNAFQLANGLGYSDGKVGNWTRSKLAEYFSTYTEPAPAQQTRTLKKGMSGNDVLVVQQQLYALGYLTATPDGVFGGMTEAAVSEFQIANGLGYSDGMVGNWTRTKLASNPVAKSSHATPAATPVQTTRTLKRGMTGEDVKAVQQQLYALGYLTAEPDGSFGGMTEAAVSEFQIANGLGYSDGMVGNWTRTKLANNPVAKSSGGSSVVAPVQTSTRTLKRGMTGEDVKAVQQQLYALGYLTAEPDGSFGGMTEAAVKEFQIANGLGYSDGMVGNWTRTKLANNPIAKAPTATMGELNALSSAKSYLRYMEFSYTGLIKQLEYEGYSTQEATYAANNCGANWYEQALEQAKDYLSYSAFSYTGLVEQLEFEGYTNAEATYAVNNCGANWMEQALKKAKSYLSYSAFSYTGLIEQLEFEDFTTAEATYGANNCGADWNEQAAKSAKQYLSYSSYSKSRLIELLEYKGFTHSQAVYGVEANGY